MGVEKLKAKNYEELLDFVDLVFSQDLMKVHFGEDLGYLYAADDEHMNRQYVYRDESGKIRSAIGVIPYTYKIGNESFKAKTITNVATHHRYTGRGYMQQLLKAALDDMENDGTDFVVLHGNRERYRFWGFAMAGISHDASFKAYNIPNLIKKGEKFDFSFCEIGYDDKEYIKKSLDLFNLELQHYARTEDDFLDAQSLWHGKTYAVLDCNGKYCGYLNYSEHFAPVIREIELNSPKDAARVIYSFLNFKGLQSISVNFSVFNAELNRAIYSAAENIGIGQTTRLNLLKPERFIKECLEIKRKSGVYMPNGKIVVENDIFGRLLIENNDGFSVCKTDVPPDIKIDGDDIYLMLFGPEHRDFMPWTDKLGDKTAWFPIPFYIQNTELY